MDPTRANELFEVAETAGGRRQEAARRARDRVHERPAGRGGRDRLRPRRGRRRRADLRRLRQPELRRAHARRRRRAPLLRAQVQPGHHRARDPLRARARQPHQRARASTSPRGSIPNKARRARSSRARRPSAASASRGFFAVYEMLEGEDKYTWVKNRCTDREFESGGRVLAQFHYLAHDFDPRGLGREQPPIMQLLRDAAFRLRGLRGAGKSREQRRRRVLPGVAAGHRRGPAQGRRAGAGAAGACPTSPSTATTIPATSSGSTKRRPRWARGDVRFLVLRAVRLRLVQARLPHLRRGRGHRLLLQLVGGPRQRRAVARQGGYLRARLPGRSRALRHARAHVGAPSSPPCRA